MKNFYIITNELKDPKLAFTKEIRDFLVNLGMRCDYQELGRDMDGTGYRYTDADAIPADVECVIVLGGDGTIIQAARDTYKRGIPMLGVNMGHLGFLTDVEKDDLYATLALVIRGEYRLDSRMMLKGSVYRNGQVVYESTALNDITISRSGSLRVIDFDVYVNDEYLSSYSADGVIVATATGSTAYSLSAGGPIVQPNAEIMMITPICPHSFNGRSIVLGSDNTIAIEMSDTRGYAEERAVSFDGVSCSVVTGDRVVITRLDETVRLVKTSKRSFLQILGRKMNNQ